MKNKKEFAFFVFLISLIILSFIKPVFALGLSPARSFYNFEPNLETSIQYIVFEDNPKKELEIYVSGEFAKFVELDTTKLIGGGVFTAKLKITEEITIPGKHIIYIGVRQKVDEELAGTSIGTSIVIQGIIVIEVPYPGKYVEVNLIAHNVNVGEPVNFEMDILSKGDEDVDISPRIEIMAQEKIIETLLLKDRFLSSQQALQLKKTLDTVSYNPGTYDAVAVIDYGKIAEARVEFKIGELIIEILNYTDKVLIGDNQKFNVEIQSGWNNKIDGAYAEVNILNNTKSLISFKTSTTGLTPWEKKIITGYFDTSNFVEGIYDANISVIYFGKDVGKSTNKQVKIEFVKELNLVLIAAVILGILIILVILVLFAKRYIFNKK